MVKTTIGTTFVIGTREVCKRDKTAEVKYPKMAIAAYVICSERFQGAPKGLKWQ